MPDYGPDDPWANYTPKYSYTPTPDKESKEYGRTKYWLDVLLKENNDIEEDGFETDGPVTPMAPTTSSNPKRPRTIKAGYDFGTKTLTIVYRDGDWYEYHDVPEHMWYDFLQAESKGRYIDSSGLYTWANSNRVNMNTMPKSKRILMSDMTELLKYLYSPKKSKKEE